EGGPMHGIQAWVALPDADEECEPAFDHYDAASLPALDEAGVHARLVAGAAYGVTAPVRTRSPLCYLHVALQTGARLRLPDEHPERAVYVVSGVVEVDGASYEPGRMLVFRPGPAQLTALAPALLMLLGGAPLGPRFVEWNFVSSSRERIEQAKADWRAGRMKLPDLDNGEFIPLPGDPPPPANAMS
ncbi:MAG TPA: pirin-like C-terminal cupin domain-containing protein, partial [Xanthomonadaceae bacterium]|nr:pirin-like C-terminal cupin domain-containing protein [Xanthomonadaceae bacterium]